MKERIWHNNIVKLTVMAATICIICFMAVSSVSADTKFNINNATTLKIGEKNEFSVNHKTDNRYFRTFKFKTTANNSFYRVRMRNNIYGQIQAFYQLYDSEGDKISDFENGVPYEKMDDKNAKLKPNSWYYYGIYFYGSAKGNYTIRVNEVKDDFGDDFNTAKEIRAGARISGTLNSEKDRDGFLIRATKKGKYKIDFINQSNSELMYYDIYDSDKLLIEKSTNIGKSCTNEISMNKGEYIWVFLKAFDWQRTIDNPRDYKLKVYGPKVAKPAKVSLKSLKAGKRSLTVKFRAAKRSTYYQIALKKKGSSWNYYTTNSLSKKFKKLAKKKKYKVKVRGIRIYEGKKYYGKWSKIKSVRVK